MFDFKQKYIQILIKMIEFNSYINRIVYLNTQEISVKEKSKK